MTPRRPVELTIVVDERDLTDALELRLNSAGDKSGTIATGLHSRQQDARRRILGALYDAYRAERLELAAVNLIHPLDRPRGPGSAPVFASDFAPAPTPGIGGALLDRPEDFPF